MSKKERKISGTTTIFFFWKPVPRSNNHNPPLSQFVRIQKRKEKASVNVVHRFYTIIQQQRQFGTYSSTIHHPSFIHLSISLHWVDV